MVPCYLFHLNCFMPQVGPIIIWLVVGGVAGLDYNWVDVVVLGKVCRPIIEVDVMAVKEEDPCIDLANSTGPTEETHFLHPDTPLHISIRCVVDQPVTGESPGNILGVIFCLVKNRRLNEALDISSGEYQSSTPEGGSLYCLGFPNVFPREEIVGTGHYNP